MLSMSTSKKKNISASQSYHHGDLANTLKIQAFLLIKSKGINGLNMRDLAKRCHVSAAAVYRHYRNKDHLLAVIAEEGLNELQKNMEAAKEPKRLQKMGLAYIQFALHDPLRFRLGFESSIDKEKFPSLLKKHHETYQIVRAEVERCVDIGSMIGNIDSLTQTAWATVHGIAMLLLEDQFPKVNKRENAIKIATEITSIVGRGLTRID
jgi:AcrR family transcriptional regulator